MVGSKDEIEAVARAFYSLQDCARGWDREPRQLKEQWLNDARAAIAALDEHRSSLRSGPAVKDPCRLPDEGGSLSVRNMSTFSARIDLPGKGRKADGDPPLDKLFQVCSGASLAAAMLVAQSREQVSQSKVRIAQSMALLQSTESAL